MPLGQWKRSCNLLATRVLCAHRTTCRAACTACLVVLPFFVGDLQPANLVDKPRAPQHSSFMCA